MLRRSHRQVHRAHRVRLTAPPDASGWYRPTPFETATGAVLGHLPAERGVGRAAGRPIEVLGDLVAEALIRPPCLVGFSGGRDSSALLAVAVDVARRRGLPTPIPVTRRFVGDEAADERDWQELVIGHLGLDEWLRLELTDECDFLGTDATNLLVRRGPYYPMAAHADVPVVRAAGCGTLITGEGGDEVFGIRRSTALRHLAGGRRRARAALRELPGSIGPGRSRGRHLRHRLAAVADRTWLTAAARGQLLDALVAHHLAEPLSWRRSGLALARRRGWALGSATLRTVAADHGVTLAHPLLDRRFLTALGAHVGTLGPVSRSAALRALVGHLLPDQVLRRRTKATFNSALFGDASRRFARSWDGSGVDADLVDPDGLRSAWADEQPPAGTFLLLQALWLQQRLS